MKFTTAVAAAGLATAAVAQSISSQCQVQLGLLAVGDLGQCLSLVNLLPVVQQTNGSVVAPLNSYLGNLCASSTPKCSNATLTSAESSIQSACASDLSSTGNSATAVGVLDQIFESYPEVYSAACSKNETTNSYCVTSILYQLQNITGQDVSFQTVGNILGGSTAGLSQLNSAFNDGQLCTGCVAGIYRQAIAANSSISSIPAISSIASRCGSGFGTTAQETGVSSPSSSGSASGAASSSAVASSSRAAGYLAASSGLSAQAMLGAAAVVGGVLAGAVAVL